jgi:hypothetical protein
MQQQALAPESDGLLEANPILKQAALERSMSTGTQVSCRSPRVHNAWQRSSRGVFATCPMCDRDSLGDRPFSHH